MMKNVQPLWNRSVHQFPGNPVGVTTETCGNGHLSVAATIDGTLPRPARIRTARFI